MCLFDPSGLTGLEPAASALTGRCSDQLNYNPREISKVYRINIFRVEFKIFGESDTNYITTDPFLIFNLIFKSI